MGWRRFRSTVLSGSGRTGSIMRVEVGLVRGRGVPLPAEGEPGLGIAGHGGHAAE